MLFTASFQFQPGVDNKIDGGEEWIRTTVGISQQIYSLPRLAASVPLLMIRLNCTSPFHTQKLERAMGIEPT